jgi:hypothetical protein
VAGQFVKAAGAGLGWGVGMGLALGATGRLGGGLRPLARSAIRAGLAVSERVSAAAAEAWEQAQDLYHEALDERRQAAGGADVQAAADGARRTATLTIPGGG